MIFAASILIELGAKNVFIKGGHLDLKLCKIFLLIKKKLLL